MSAAADAEPIAPLRSDAMRHGSILASYLALPCLGKSDFAAVNGFREDAYFAEAPFDNSQSKKEGVSCAYKGEDGFGPMAGYLGEEGYRLELELRAGSQHCRKGIRAFLQRVLGRARQLTTTALLLRLDHVTLP